MRESVGPDLRPATWEDSRDTRLELASILEDRARWIAVVVCLVGDREVADDVLQIACLRAVAQCGTVRDRARFPSWFRRVLKSAAVDFIRRRNAYQRALRRFASEAGLGDVDLDSDETTCTCIDSVFLTLRPSYAAIIRKIHLEGCSLEETARAAGISATNARVRLHRARRTLRSRLTEHCGGPPLEGCAPCTCESETICRRAKCA